MILFGRPGWSRLAVAAALVAALGLSACGRKGPLDPPPSAAAPRQDGAPGQQAPAAALGPDGRPVAGQPKRGEPFFLDFLLN